MAGLPKIKIDFFGHMKQRPKRVAAGTVVLVLRDDEMTGDTYKYTRDSAIDGWSEVNQRYIKMALKGGPQYVIVERLPSTDEGSDWSVALDRLRNKKFDYMALPGITDDETNDIVEWVKERRDNGNKVKAVLPNTAANNIGVINFTSSGLVDKDGTEYTTSEYTARIAGGLTGLPFEWSATYLVMDDLAKVDAIDDPDGAVNNGELILIDDGEKIKIGRGVNSLTKIEKADKMNDEFKSIRVVEILDMIYHEIHKQFEDHYIGKVPNRYDNQVLFIGDVIEGFEDLEQLQLLESRFDNSVEIDIEAQRKAWEDEGIDTSDWDDQKVKETSFKRNVYLRGKIQVVDTVEDLDFNIHL